MELAKHYWGDLFLCVDLSGYFAQVWSWERTENTGGFCLGLLFLLAAHHILLLRGLQEWKATVERLKVGCQGNFFWEKKINKKSSKVWPPFSSSPDPVQSLTSSVLPKSFSALRETSFSSAWTRFFTFLILIHTSCSVSALLCTEGN